MAESKNAGPAARSARRLYVAAAAAILTYFGARFVLEMHHLQIASRLTAALLPVPFFAWLSPRLADAGHPLLHRAVRGEAAVRVQ